MPRRIVGMTQTDSLTAAPSSPRYNDLKYLNKKDRGVAGSFAKNHDGPAWICGWPDIRRQNTLQIRYLFPMKSGMGSRTRNQEPCCFDPSMHQCISYRSSRHSRGPLYRMILRDVRSSICLARFGSPVNISAVQPLHLCFNRSPSRL